MRIRRTIGALLAATLAAGTVGVVAAPAQAATYETRIVAGSSSGTVYTYSKPVVYGDTIAVSAAVEAFVDGAWERIYEGTITATAKTTGVKGSKKVFTDTDAGDFDTIEAKGNTTITISYAGSGEYLPTAKAFKVKKVQRDIYGKGIPGNKTGFTGTIKPKEKVKITIFRKQGKWKKFKTIRSNAKGRWRVGLPAPRRNGTYKWKLVFAGNKQFAPSALTGTTTTY